MEATFRPPSPDRWGPGLSLSLVAHALLVLGLTSAVSWKVATTEVAVEAEIWSEVPRGAPPAPPPEPPPAPAPAPAPAPDPVRQPPPRAPEPEVEKRPDIVTERSQPKPKPKAPREVFDTTPPKPRKPEPSPKAETRPKDKPSPQEAQREARLAAEREAQRRLALDRMMNELGGSGGSGVPGAVSAGPSPAYAGRIKARIKPNIVFTEQASGNPLAKVEVRCAPDGRIISRRLVASSGLPAWDEAVLRAVDRTEVLPANEQGKVPSPMLLEFRPNDL